MLLRYFLLVFLLIIFHTGICKSIDIDEIKNFEIEFNKILVNLDSVILNSKNQHETLVSHYNFVKNKINNKELPITFDSTLNYDFYGCASFNVAVDNPKDISISYGQFMIDKYTNHPSLIYAIIINTFQNAYDYFNNQDLFLISTNNQIEKTFFEVDAITLEAVFLSIYMKNSPSLGYVEKYLIQDLANHLSGSSILFIQTDLELLHKMDNLKSEDKSADKLLKEFNNIGKDLIRTINFKSDSKWVNYCSVITLRTYVYYCKQVMFDIVHIKNGTSRSSFNLENYPENLETINKIQKIIEANVNYLAYHHETLKLLGDYYKKSN